MQLLDQQEGAQAAVLKAASLKEVLQQQHQQELAAVKEAHSAALSRAQRQHQHELATERDTHAAALAQLQHQHQHELDAQADALQSQLPAQLQAQHEQQMGELEEAHAGEQQALRQQQQEQREEYAADLRALQQAHESDLNSIRDAHQYELATRLRAHKVGWCLRDWRVLRCWTSLAADMGVRRAENLHAQSGLLALPVCVWCLLLLLSLLFHEHPFAQFGRWS